MFRRFLRRSTHDKALILATVMAAIAVIVGIAGMDGESHEACVMAFCCGISWIYLFTFANADRWM